MSITPSPLHLAAVAWHSTPDPPNTFAEILDFHLSTPGAVVISLPDSFLMARPVIAAQPETHLHFTSPLQSPPIADCWHVASAAGSVRALLMLAHRHPLPWVSYCRHGQDRIRLHQLHTLLRHGLPEISKTPRTSPATSPR